MPYEFVQVLGLHFQAHVEHELSVHTPMRLSPFVFRDDAKWQETTFIAKQIDFVAHELQDGRSDTAEQLSCSPCRIVRGCEPMIERRFLVPRNTPDRTPGD